MKIEWSRIAKDQGCKPLFGLSYAFFNKKELVHLVPNVACFAGIQNNGEHAKKNGANIIAAYFPEIENTSANRKYLSYLIRRSRWSKFILNKAVYDMIENGIQIDMTATSTPEAMQALSVYRYCHEAKTVIEYWNKFKKYCDEDTALFLAHYVSPIGDGTFSMDGPRWNSNHSMLQVPLTKTEYTNFLKHKAAISLPPMLDDFSYAGFSAMYGGPKYGRSIYTGIPNHCLRFRFKDIEKKVKTAHYTYSCIEQKNIPVLISKCLEVLDAA